MEVIAINGDPLSLKITYDKDLNRITDLPMLVHNVELMSFKLARNDNRRRATDSLPYFHRQKV